MRCQYLLICLIKVKLTVFLDQVVHWLSQFRGDAGVSESNAGDGGDNTNPSQLKKMLRSCFAVMARQPSEEQWMAKEYPSNSTAWQDALISVAGFTPLQEVLIADDGGWQADLVHSYLVSYFEEVLKFCGEA